MPTHYPDVLLISSTVNFEGCSCKKQKRDHNNESMKRHVASTRSIVIFLRLHHFFPPQMHVWMHGATWAVFHLRTDTTTPVIYDVFSERKPHRWQHCSPAWQGGSKSSDSGSHLADMLAGSRLSHTTIIYMYTRTHSCFYLCVQLRRCHGGHSRCPLLRVVWVTNLAGLLAAWEPTLRSTQPGGEKPCSCRRGLCSVGRCAPYRHDNRPRGLRLLPRFRRLTLHSGYDGWNDSAKTERGPSCRLPGETAPPGGQDVEVHPPEDNTRNMAVYIEGVHIYQVAVLVLIWDWIAFNSWDLPVRWFSLCRYS